jgi:adenosylmethionine-8-amino-7-oxononanoate aminotransferase
MGLLAGVELVKNKDTKTSWGLGSAFIKSVQMGLERRGLLTRTWNTLFLSPPLVATRDELGLMVEMIDDTLTAAELEFVRDIDATDAAVGCERSLLPGGAIKEPAEP